MCQRSVGGWTTAYNEAPDDAAAAFAISSVTRSCAPPCKARKPTGPRSSSTSSTPGSASRDPSRISSVPLVFVDDAFERFILDEALEVLEEQLEDLAAALGRAPGDVRADPHLGMREQPVPFRERLRIDGVERGHGNAPLVERYAEPVLVDQSAAGDVHQMRALAHLRERLGVEQMMGTRRVGRGDDHVVG